MDTTGTTDLTAEELAAIRSNIADATRVARREVAPPPARPISLVADDRSAARARPRALAFARRWAMALGRVLTGTDLRVAEAGNVSVDALAESLPSMVARRLALPGGHGALVLVSGELVQAWTERMLGARDAAASNRAPSHAVLRVFAPTADALVTAAAQAWQAELGGSAERADDAGDAGALLREADPIVPWMFVDLQPREAAGTIRLAAPATSWAPTVRDAAVPSVPSRLRNDVLGAIDVCVRVDLGVARLSARQVRALRPGMLLPLDRTVGSALPIHVGGLLKAHGHPAVDGDLIAIEVAPESLSAERKTRR